MPPFFRKHGYRLMNQQTAEGGEGGGGQPSKTDTVDVQAQIEAAVAGLKAKNSELLGKLKERDEAIKRFDGIDPDAVRGILQRFSDDEEAKLIAGGKIDEVLNRRTDRMKQDYDKQFQAKDAELQRYLHANQKLAQRALSDAVAKAAVKAGALPTALDDIVLRAQHSGWTVNEDGEVIARKGEEVLFGKDGKTPLTAEEWAESLREAAPHLFQQPQGTGAPGSRGGGSGKTMKRADFARLTPAEQVKTVQSGIQITD